MFYTIPLVIYVLHLGEEEGFANNISDEQIFSGIEQLNSGFRSKSGQGIDTNIQFQLAKQTPEGKSTTGILRVNASNIKGYEEHGVADRGEPTPLGAGEVELKNTSKWDNARYYNIWIVSKIEASNIQAFAYFPGTSPDYDGTMILNTAWDDQGKTIIHELGHALGLYHTYEAYSEDGLSTKQNGCPENTNCNTQGDLCCDTDPHIQVADFTVPSLSLMCVQRIYMEMLYIII